MTATRAAAGSSSAGRGCALLVSACLLSLVAACALGVVGVRLGAVALPWFERSAGGILLVGYSTWNADCPPYQGCAPTRQESYVAWVVLRSGEGERAVRLLRLPIER